MPPYDILSQGICLETFFNFCHNTGGLSWKNGFAAIGINTVFYTATPRYFPGFFLSFRYQPIGSIPVWAVVGDIVK